MNITLSATLTTMLISFILPAAVSLLTKITAHPFLKQFVNGALAAATGLITTGTLSDGTAVFSKQSLILAIGAFILSQANYVSLYKPNNVALMPDKGLG